MYYLPIFFPSGVVAFRMFRIVRIFRLDKSVSQLPLPPGTILAVNMRRKKAAERLLRRLTFIPPAGG